jgi:hypothetical protein
MASWATPSTFQRCLDQARKEHRDLLRYRRLGWTELEKASRTWRDEWLRLARLCKERLA